ncbi:MAG: hypothetical protein JNG84_15275 [Archangium sp.]|nr:hypothetical protein [Archangium sp.]
MPKRVSPRPAVVSARPPAASKPASPAQQTPATKASAWQPTSAGRATTEPRVTSLRDIEALTAELIATSFPELADSAIGFKPMSGDAFFFEVKPSLRRVLAPKGHGPMTVRVNPLALDGTLSRSAAKAILAHELSHLSRLDTKGVAALAEGAWANSAGKVLANGKALKSVERRTDLDAIFRGYGKGLVEYRKWQYPRLAPDALETKRATYFTPEEISAIDAAITDNPALRQVWWRTPPLSLADIERDVRRTPKR